MSAAPVKDAPANVIPEERFWRRYSPHGEAPLSVAGSFAAHAVGVGGLVLVALYLASLFVSTPGKLPVTPVRIGDGGLPGKVGPPGGNGNVAAPQEDVEIQADLLPEMRDERRPALNPAQMDQIANEFDPDSARWINFSPSDSAKVFGGLQKGLRDKLRANLAGDRPGPGEGGAKGPAGPPGGAAKTKFTDREKRQLRWHMRFTANSGDEYLQQLKSLGAILGFPLGDDNPVFHVVRDLRPGTPAKVEDVTTFNRIYWIDDKPRSVQDVMDALRLQLPERPTRFVAFLPEALEKRLYDLERNYVKNILRRRFDEDAILATTFRCVGTPMRGYHPEIINVSMR